MKNGTIKAILIALTVLYVISPLDIAPGQIADDAVILIGSLLLQKQLSDD